MGSRTNEEAARYMQSFFKHHATRMPQDNFDSAFNHATNVRSATVASPGVSAKAVVAFTIPRQYSNQPLGNPQTSHGGAVALFFDITTSLAIVATNVSGWDSTGVSRRLDVTYFRPPVEGDEVVIESEVIQIGKRLATIRGVMRREKDGAVLATCQHDKYMADQPHYKVGAKL